jgi:hypothetical protein
MPAVDEVYSRARQLIFLHQLRTLDALQLASAIEASNFLEEPLVFVSSVRNLLKAATAEKFAVDNPYLHS